MGKSHPNVDDYVVSRVRALEALLLEKGVLAPDSVDRVIHVPLSEEDWQAFLATTPRPVDWLRERIREAIEKQRDNTARA